MKPLATSERSTLPLALTRFIGREKELGLAAERLDESRLVTLVGPGGIGKTRLAVEAARAWLDAHPADAWFVDLSPVRDEVGVDRAVAAAVGVVDDGKTDLGQQVLGYLRDGSALVVLDNCEQVIEAAAAYADRLLRGCPDLHLMATSREPLALTGESLLEVPPLDLESEAPILFAERARATAGQVALEGQPDLVREICRQLDGMPLAIELAAARTRALSLSEINARLNDRFALLSTAGRNAPERHRTLAAAVEWSYQLLPPAEATLYARLAAFAGGWTLAAAEEVCSADGISRENVVVLLASLVDRSLVARDASAEPARYRMLETIRVHAASKLQERDPWSRRHFAWILELTTKAEVGMRGPAQIDWLDRLSTERDNIRSALTWAASREDLVEERLRMATLLVRFWWFRGPRMEGESWLRRFAASAIQSVATVRASIGIGILAFAAGDLPAARAEFEKAVREARIVGDEARLGESLGWLAGMNALQDPSGTEAAAILAECRPLLERSGTDHDLALLALFSIWACAQVQRDWQADLALLRQVGDRWPTGGFLNSLGEMARQNNDLDAAREYYQQALAERQPLGLPGGRPWAMLANLAFVELMAGDGPAAVPLLQASLRRAAGAPFLHWMALGLLGAGVLAALRGEHGLGARLLGAAAAVDDSVGLKPAPADAAVAERGAALAIEGLGEVEFERQFQAGRYMDPEAAADEAEALLARAAAEQQAAEPSRTRPGGLSRQEAEVLRLLASGHTNREIAATLVLSVRTVENHIANAYGKIGARGRSEATRWAVANGLVAASAGAPE